MKKYIYFLIPIIFITGCVDVKIEEMKYNEVFGVAGSEFEGKIFSAKCSSEGANATTVNNTCLKEIAKTTYNKGYQYFYVFFQDNETLQQTGSYTTSTPVTTYNNNYSGYGYSYGASTTYVPKTTNYTIERNNKYYGFILVDEEEISKYPNYYRVSDYYAPTR